MGYIYIITNDINNKVYIGQTISTIEHRWGEHKAKAYYVAGDSRNDTAFYGLLSVDFFYYNLFGPAKATVRGNFIF